MKKILKNDPNKTVSGKKQTVEHERKSLGKKIQNWIGKASVTYIITGLRESFYSTSSSV